MKKLILFFFLMAVFIPKAGAWGFFAHQRINRLAVFTLPPEMLGFYKYYIQFISENAVNPDKRRYVIKAEAPRHYLDADIYDKFYNDSAIYKLPRYWKAAVERFGEDTLQAYGIVPWHIERVKYQLIEAFKNRNVSQILRISTDLGHYIADANVPLHTTENYNGQKTNQLGIHGFWESRLPELFSDKYDFFIGKANYLKNTQLRAWQAVIEAHLALDSVLKFEKELTERFPEDKKYTFEERNKVIVRTYSRDFAKAYHQALGNQVERRMRAAIKMLGDFWFTCWVEAGQPDLSNLLNIKYLDESQKEIEKEKLDQTDPSIAPRLEGSSLNIPAKSQDCCANNPYWAFYQRKNKARKQQNGKLNEEEGD